MNFSITDNSPKHLFKILSVENWHMSQGKEALKLAQDDMAFIHFSTEEQVDKIAKKYWSNLNEYVVLKIEAKKLSGKLVFESNDGGENKYFHLYEGFIPTTSVVEFKIIKNS